MAGASLSRLPEESVTDSGEVIEPDSFRVGAKPIDDFFSTFHTPMVSLMILSEKTLAGGPVREELKVHMLGIHPSRQAVSE